MYMYMYVGEVWGGDVCVCWGGGGGGLGGGVTGVMLTKKG